MAHLPKLTFSLPEWRESDFAALVESSEKLSEIAANSGKTSDRFTETCNRLLSIAVSGSPGQVPLAIQSNIDVRAATFLLCNSEDFVGSGVLSPEFLRSLLNPRSHLSRLSLLHLVRSFLNHFDTMADQPGLVFLAAFIKKQLAFHQHPHHRDSQTRRDDALARSARYKDLIFAVDGPGNVVRSAVTQGNSLESQLETFGLAGYGEGRFQHLCRYRFYIETLKEIPVGDNHRVLEDLADTDVHMAPGADGRTIGHEALMVLIDRSAVEASESWRGLILSIAGDPRVSVRNRRYQQWWALLGSDRIEKVSGWLSRFDLSLFLGALEEYGKSIKDEDLQRMFPARKRFLEGLVEQGAVVASRLFVGGKARDYLRRNYRRNELPDYASVSDPYRSMIYLRVGHCHLVEGSHNCKLRIFPKLPAKSAITDYGVKQFTPYDLGRAVERHYQEEFGISPFPAAIVHNPRTFAWQHEAITYFAAQGIRLDTEKLFSAADYRQYKTAHGVHIWAG